MKRDLARKHARFYIIDAAKLAADIGLGKHTNNILQGAFFALTNVIPMDVAVADMKKNNYATYFKKAGQKIVDLNDKAVDVGITAAVKVDIPAAWADAQDAIRKELLIRLYAIKSAGIAAEAVEAYRNGWNKHETSRAVTDALLAALEKAEQTEDVKYILENREYLAKKSVWAVGGDGWAYDIGFGGIDHVMAQNRDVNLMVLDTEVYSNTGGQSSKATPTSATAKFSAGGKQVAKKDLGGILMQYGYVYVAQVAMGADQAQTLRALREAEAYDGPSIVICYCPCLEQHIKAGMGCTQEEMKKAVECGYWQLYRYDPRRTAEGKNPFQLDSPEPDTDKLMDFLMGENRFAALKNNFPEKADALYAKEIADVKARYAKYKRMAEED